MNEGLIPSRYAKALYLFGREKGDDKVLYNVMKTLSDSFAKQPSLQEVLGNPFISDADKTALLVTASGVKPSDTVFNDFLKLLSQNHRLGLARGIALAYIDLYRKENKIYEVKITSAASMSDAEETRLRDLIARHLDGGTMECVSAVDPSLIGGFTVSVGNERIDASISNELKKLRLNLIS